MATIPMGNFGQAIARPGPMPNAPRVDAMAGAAQRTGQIAAGVLEAEAEAETRQQLEVRNAAEQARSRAPRMHSPTCTTASPPV